MVSFLLEEPERIRFIKIIDGLKMHTLSYNLQSMRIRKVTSFLYGELASV
jgi:hypothetical protein